MNEQLKFVVQTLNKDFSKNYNLISFDSLETIQLLQVLNDVCATIDSKHKMDLREEPADQTAVRLFSFLRILKYRPQNVEMGEFQQALVTGDKPVIYSVLEWLLQRMDEMKKRAYLARYLVKLDIPAEIMQDDQISDLYTQYEVSLEEFKELHKKSEQLKNSGFSTDELRKDISSMEVEKEQLLKRVDKARKKVESQPNSGPMLQVARNLRTERDRETKLSQQKQDQRNAVVHCEQRIKRLQQQLHDARQASIGASPKGLLQKLEMETKVNHYMVTEKLPKEISLKKKSVQDLQRVANEPAMGQSDLNILIAKIDDLNKEINQLIEKKMKSSDLLDSKRTIFRQQAMIVVRKKEGAAEALADARTELQTVRQELNEKRDLVKDVDSRDTLKGEDFKRFVNKLRSKSTVYKKKRQELQELRAECGVLARTLEVLRQRNEQFNQQLATVEAKKGVSGYRTTQEELEKVSSFKSELDDVKGRTLDDISDMVKMLHANIAEKKSALAPIIKELRPMRQKHQELLQSYEEAKSRYESTSVGYESNRHKVEQEVRGLREEISAEESRLYYIQCTKHILQVQHEKVTEEMKLYTHADPSERKKAFREQYNKRVQEQETLGKQLRDRQKMVKENHGPSIKQKKMWDNFLRLMEVKHQCLNGGGAVERSLGGGVGADVYSADHTGAQSLDLESQYY